MRNTTIGFMAALALAAAPAAFAEDHALDGLEMDVMDANATPSDASTKVLALPDTASERAHERAQRGLDRANAAREAHDEGDQDEGSAEGASGGGHGHDTQGQDHSEGAPGKP